MSLLTAVAIVFTLLMLAAGPMNAIKSLLVLLLGVVVIVALFAAVVFAGILIRNTFGAETGSWIVFWTLLILWLVPKPNRSGP